MKINVLYFLGTFMILFSCKQGRSTLNQDSSVLKIHNVQPLIEEILQSSKLNKYFHFINNDEMELFIVKQDSLGITDDLKIERRGKILKVVDFSKLKKDSIKSFIYFENLEIYKDRASVKLYYDIEGMGYEGDFSYINGKWTEMESKTWEN